VACAAWIYLLTARGGFWRTAQREHCQCAADAQSGAQDREWPSVVAIIPARNESAVIGETVRSLLRQDYRGNFAVLVVDDHSSDDTVRVAGRMAESTRRLCGNSGHRSAASSRGLDRQAMGCAMRLTARCRTLRLALNTCC
jgi:cellulose synthase/poly-beta-1,6-N-acetylglucosamine synthase-like glycosyltransferase